MDDQCPYYGGLELKGKLAGLRCGRNLLTVGPEAATSQEDFCLSRNDQSPMECRAFLVQSIHDKAVNIRSNHTIAELQEIYHKVKDRPGCIGCEYYWYSAGYTNAAPHPEGLSGYEGWKQWMANAIPCECLTHYCRPDINTLHKITAEPQIYCKKEDAAMTYYTKCGREFAKSGKAVVTGYHLTKTPEEQIQDEQCKACPFVVDVQEGYPQTHKRYECRAGSKPPNHETTYRGRADDKCTMQVDSLDHELLERIRFWCIEHPELSAAYNADCMADCRRSLSISCSQNRKGMAAKQELLELFFPSTPATPDPDFEPETCGDCVYYSDDACNADDKPKPARASTLACVNFCPPRSGLDFCSSEEPEEDCETEPDSEAGTTEKPRRPKCPYLSSIEERKINCGCHPGKKLGTVAFDTNSACQHKTDNHCFDRFLDCEHYRKYYLEQLEEEGADVCIHCCNNSWYTGLPDGFSGQEWCFCQLKQEPMEHDKAACEWFNRHPDWTLPRTGLQGCQEMREDCPCFCKHNDGCAVLLCSGNALKDTIEAFADRVDCEVFTRVANEVLGVPAASEDLPEECPHYKGIAKSYSPRGWYVDCECKRPVDRSILDNKSWAVAAAGDWCTDSNEYPSCLFFRKAPEDALPVDLPTDVKPCPYFGGCRPRKGGGHVYQCDGVDHSLDSDGHKIGKMRACTGGGYEDCDAYLMLWLQSKGEKSGRLANATLEELRNLYRGYQLKEESACMQQNNDMTDEPVPPVDLAADQVAAPRPLAEITLEIKWYKAQTAQNMLEIGRRLSEAKSQLEHGEWLDWLEHQAEFSARTATNLMRIANEYSNRQALADLPYTKLVALLSVPADEREEFAATAHEVGGEQKSVEDMTTRELERVIKERDEARNAAQVNETIALDRRRLLDVQGAELSELRSQIRSKDSKIKELEHRPIDVAVEKPSEADKERLRDDIRRELQEQSTAAALPYHGLADRAEEIFTDALEGASSLFLASISGLEPRTGIGKMEACLSCLRGQLEVFSMQKNLLMIAQRQIDPDGDDLDF